MSDKVTRYVVTHKEDKTGLRVLTFACQGRDTYATMAEAEAAVVEWNTPHGLQRVLSPAECASLQARPVECWAGHHDPVGIYFED